MFGSLSKTLKSNWYNNKDNNIVEELDNETGKLLKREVHQNELSEV